jgi:hypothetical protein
MKNQYAGDVNDYVKYSLIRRLAAGSRDRVVTVCWMLTYDDDRTDGNLRAYLSAPERFRRFDPVVFDALSRIVHQVPSVAAVERQGVIEGAKYFSGVLRDERGVRRSYFERFWTSVRPGSLLFFDPDNGLEVKSVPKGRKNSAKYLYWDELAEGLGRGHSVVVYQHFPRVPRERYVAMLLERARQAAPQHSSCVLCSPRVAYLISAASHDRRGLAEAARSIERRWAGLLRLVL